MLRNSPASPAGEAEEDEEMMVARGLAGIADEMKSRAHIINENRCAYDVLYHCITSRDTLLRRRMVQGIRQYLEQRFARELANEADPSFRQTLDEFFRNCSRNDRIGNVLQMYCIYVSLLLDKKVLNHLLPPPPDPDTDDDDGALVSRVPFTVFMQKYLEPMAKILLNGQEMRPNVTLTVPLFCQELNGVYTALSASNPLAETNHRRRRHVTLQPLPNLP